MLSHLAALFAMIAVALSADWDRVPGSAVQISAKGNELWAVTRYNQVLRWKGNGWSYLHYSTYTNVGASPDGHAWASNTNQHDVGLARFDGANFVGYSGGGCSAINVISKDKAVCAGKDGRAYKWEGGWVNLDGTEGNCLHIAIGDSNEIWKIDQNGNLHKYVGGSWSALSDRNHPKGLVAKYVDVQAPGKIVVTDVENHIWHFDGKDTWHKLSGKDLNCKQATISYKKIYCIDTKDGIWSLDFEDNFQLSED